MHEHHAEARIRDGEDGQCARPRPRSRVANITLRKYNWGFDPQRTAGLPAATLKVVRSIGGRRVGADSDDRPEQVAGEWRFRETACRCGLEEPLPPRQRSRPVEWPRVGRRAVAKASAISALAVGSAAQGAPLYIRTTRAPSDSTEKDAVIVLSCRHGHEPSPDQRNDAPSRPPYAARPAQTFGGRR
jgi:hypothetical protein